ncbi:hypothetical protein B0H14DRAFT_1515958 [Mycena olivaceomarginata]|nr:hypothetical protein B0H14DRAFT_1515958 [Mycena olivaceomarginata]
MRCPVLSVLVSPPCGTTRSSYPSDSAGWRQEMDSESEMQIVLECRGQLFHILGLCPTSAPFLSGLGDRINTAHPLHLAPSLPAPRLWTTPPRVRVHTISAFDPIPKLCDRALPATGYRGPRRRAYAHSEPCSRERAGCGWTGWGRVGRREECMALSTSPSCVVLSIFERAVGRILGRRRGGLKMQGDVGTQQTRAHAQCTYSGLAPLSVSSAASEAVEAAAEGTRAQSYSS